MIDTESTNFSADVSSGNITTQQKGEVKNTHQKTTSIPEVKHKEVTEGGNKISKNEARSEKNDLKGFKRP
jgi:hypothetical protein